MAYRRPRQGKHKTHVKRSQAGLGLFAGTAIKRGDFIIEYDGPIMNDDEANEKGGLYQFAIDKKWTVDGSSRKNKARYINHSCHPNCEPEIEGKRVFIHALRKIQPNEELTYNYGKEYFNDYIKPFGCKCGHHRKRS